MSSDRKSLHPITISLIVGAILSSAILAFIAYRISTLSIWPDVEPKPFNSIEWKAWTMDDMLQSEDIRRSFARQDMFDDLMKQHALIGLTFDEVKVLLGEPDERFRPKEWDAAYLLGADFVDYKVLVLSLNEEQRVDGIEVILL